VPLGCSLVSAAADVHGSGTREDPVATQDAERNIGISDVSRRSGWSGLSQKNNRMRAI
jgi:hypothetical protein